jgi:hypothetical protein
MNFDTFDRTGSAEFPFNKQIVFRAVCEAVDQIGGMSVERRDDLSTRLDIKTGVSAFSWGERVSVSVIAHGSASLVSVQSGAKTIFGSGTTHGKKPKKRSGDIEQDIRYFRKERRAVDRRTPP